MNLAVVTPAAAGLVAWLAAQGAHRPAGDRVRRPARLAGVRRADRPGGHRRGPAGAAAAPAAAHPGARLRGAAPRTRAAGVMVTASHNPPQDNGYKVYLGRRAGRRRAAPARRSCRRPTPRSRRRSGRSGRWPRCRSASPGEVLGDDIVAVVRGGRGRRWSTRRGPARPDRGVHPAARGRRGACSPPPSPGPASPLPVVVAEQAEPDPDFPTVAFPNPEEPGAMDRLLALAPSDRRRHRRSPTTRTPTGARWRSRTGARPGGWRMLRGDEVGVLLADHLMRRGVPGSTPPRSSRRRCCGRCAPRAACRTTRRSPGSSGSCGPAAGRAAGLRLRGGARLLRRPGPGPGQGRHHRRAARRRAGRRAQGARGVRSPTGWTSWPREFGVHLTDQLSVRVDDLPEIADGDGAGPRASPGARCSTSRSPRSRTWLPEADVVILRTGTARVVVRPSGTEPKLKAYLEVVEPVADGDVAGGPRAGGRRAARPAHRDRGRSLSRAPGATLS